jgi:hypothetical protein
MSDMKSSVRRVLGVLAGGFALTATAGLTVPQLADAQVADQTQQETTATRGDNGGTPGYWVTVKERVFSWEAQTFIDVVAFYRPYRGTWLDWLATGRWDAGWGMTPYGYIPSWHAGGRYDYPWESVNEDKVKAAVAATGYNTIRNYVRDKTSADWQNHGVIFLDPETNTIVGSMYVNNSYDAAGKVQSMLNNITNTSLDTGTFQLRLSATSVLSSPIVLDIAGLGKPDLLAGPVWNAIPGRKIASNALRQFDLDGTGEYTWEWVGPKSALLVWDADGKGNITSGAQLFGNHTWGKKWKDGYEALATLDENGDGQVTVREFGNLGLWIDANSNAISEKGEVKSLVEMGIESISVKAQRDARGNAWAPAGFVRKMPGGQAKTLASWDWMAMGNAQAMEGTYLWVGNDGDMKLGGYMNLYREGDEVRGITVPTVGVPPLPKGILAAFPITGKRKGETIKWSIPHKDGTVTSEVTWENGGKHLYGTTRVNTKAVKTEYSWQAELISGRPIGSRVAGTGK